MKGRFDEVADPSVETFSESRGDVPCAGPRHQRPDRKKRQGKTNILEAVSYFSLGKSFFAAADTQVVQYGQEFFEVQSGIE
jgi:hypothetical protein